MKTIVMATSLAAAVAVGATMVAAQNDASGAAASGIDRRSYDVGSFEKIVAVGPHHFVVTVGNATSVRAEGPAESLDKYVVEVEDGALEIRPKRENWDEWEDWEQFHVEPATYYITLPRLEATVLAGSGDMIVDRIAGEDFHASVAGSGELAIAALSVENARLAVAGSGKLKAAGSARDIHVSIAGSGDLEARGLTSDTAKISIAGSGDASLTVDREAHMSVVGSGDVEIAGNASCTISGFGSGSARCKDGVHDTKQEWGAWTMRDEPRAWGRWEDWDQNWGAEDGSEGD